MTTRKRIIKVLSIALLLLASNFTPTHSNAATTKTYQSGKYIETIKKELSNLKSNQNYKMILEVKGNLSYNYIVEVLKNKEIYSIKGSTSNFENYQYFEFIIDQRYIYITRDNAAEILNPMLSGMRNPDNQVTQEFTLNNKDEMLKIDLEKNYQKEYINLIKNLTVKFKERTENFNSEISTPEKKDNLTKNGDIYSNKKEPKFLIEIKKDRLNYLYKKGTKEITLKFFKISNEVIEIPMISTEIE